MYVTLCVHVGVKRRLSAGRSYAGKYVPLLGQAILKGNQEGAKPSINLEVCSPRHLVLHTTLLLQPCCGVANAADLPVLFERLYTDHWQPGLLLDAAQQQGDCAPET